MEINPPSLLLWYWSLMSRGMKAECTYSYYYARTTLQFCWVGFDDHAVCRRTWPIFPALVLNFVQICVTWLSGVIKVKFPCAEQKGPTQEPQKAQGQNVSKLTQDSSYQEKPNPNFRHIM